MITREHVDNFLRINHVSCDAPDEVIKEVLAAARWDAQDVAYALRGDRRDREIIRESLF